MIESKKITLACALVTAAILTAGCVSNPDGPADEQPAASLEPQSASSAEESLLFVQTSRSALLTPLAGEPGAYQLRLVSPDPRITYFSDRPFRDAGTISAEGMIEEVFESSVPPNAALVGKVPGTLAPVTIPVEIDNPVHDGASDTMSYRARPLDGLSEGLSHLEASGGAALPTSLEEVELFIDAAKYHRCAAELTNNTDYTFTLDVASMDPPADSPKWTKEDTTIPAHGSIDWNLRFKRDNVQNSKNEEGRLVYYTDGDSRYSLSPYLECWTAASGMGVTNENYSRCETDQFAAPFVCTLKMSSDSHTARFTVSPR